MLSRFQTQGFRDGETGDDADDSKDNNDDTGSGVHADEKVEGRRSSSYGEGQQAESMLFRKIVREYIMDGARNEINIR